MAQTSVCVLSAAKSFAISVTRPNTRKPFPLMDLLHNLRTPRGWGYGKKKNCHSERSEESAFGFSARITEHCTRATFLAHPINFSKYSFARSHILHLLRHQKSPARSSPRPDTSSPSIARMIHGKSTLPFPIATSSPKSFGFVGHNPSFA